MSSVVVVASVWGALAVIWALLVGRLATLADRRTTQAPWTDQVEEFLREQTSLAGGARAPGMRTSGA